MANLSTSHFLAKAIGLYLIIVTAALLLNASFLIHVFRDILNNIPLLLTCSIFSLILGIVLVLSHNVWHRDWRGLITLLCWLTLVKGSFNLLFPHMALKLNKAFMQHPSAYYIDAVVFLLIGIYLCYKGFKKHAA